MTAIRSASPRSPATRWASTPASAGTSSSTATSPGRGPSTATSFPTPRDPMGCSGWSPRSSSRMRRRRSACNRRGSGLRVRHPEHGLSAMDLSQATGDEAERSSGDPATRAGRDGRQRRVGGAERAGIELAARSGASLILVSVIDPVAPSTAGRHVPQARRSGPGASARSALAPDRRRARSEASPLSS